MKRKNFRTPNHDIKIEAHELLLINTKCFQRLFSIKQLGFADRIYPFATHTRAAHCLDCLDMSQRFIDALEENIGQSESIKEDEREKFLQRIRDDTPLIRTAALMHDIMHIPYAHTLEDENDIFEEGDKSERIDIMIDKVKKELEELKASPELAPHVLFGFKDQSELEEEINKVLSLLQDVKRVLWTIGFPDEETIANFVDRKAKKECLSEAEKAKIRGKIEKAQLEPERFYIADIIGNTISADLLSYILRDVQFTGIEMKPGFLYRLFDYIQLRQNEKTGGKTRMVIKLTKKGDWRHDVLSAIIGILNVRYALTEAVTYHHAKCEAGSMLGKIASLCNLTESKELYDLGDEGFMNFLGAKIDEMSKRPEHRREAAGARKLLELLRSRRFYKRFHVVPASLQKGPDRVDLSEFYSFSKHRLELETKLEKDFGLPPGSVIIFCPGSKVALKEAEALVVYEQMGSDGNLQETVEKLNSDRCLENLRMRHQSLADRVKNVMEQYRALWKLYVFVDPSIIPIYGEAIKRELLKQKLGAGDTIFDQYYVCQRYEYGLSKKIEQEVRQCVPEPQISAVYKEIPSAIATIMRKEGDRNRSDWVSDRVKEIVETAKQLMESRGKQKELPI